MRGATASSTTPTTARPTVDSTRPQPWTNGSNTSGTSSRSAVLMNAAPGFMRANYIITWAWTAALVLMLIADIAMIYLPDLPLWIGLGVAFAARNCAPAAPRQFISKRIGAKVVEVPGGHTV